jgi:putative endonuclease
MAWVYILECSDGTFYTGSTLDLERRIIQHNDGVGANYTARRRPVRLLWCAEFERIDEAFGWEKRIQGWSRAKKSAVIEGRMDELAGWSSREREARRDGESALRLAALAQRPEPRPEP